MMEVGAVFTGSRATSKYCSFYKQLQIWWPSGMLLQVIVSFYGSMCVGNFMDMLCLLIILLDMLYVLFIWPDMLYVLVIWRDMQLVDNIYFC